MHVPLVSSLTSAFSDLLFPPACLLCLRPGLQLKEGFCPECVKLWQADTAVPGCATCGATCAANPAPDGRCPACRKLQLPVDAVVRLGVYGEALGALVGRLKFHGDGAISRRLGDLLADQVLAQAWASGIDVVVPVPSAWTRRLGRPLHAPTELARRIALKLRRANKLAGAAIDGPLVRFLLKRHGHPATQTGRTLHARRANVHGTFQLSPGIEADGCTVLLVDDVVTSRATSFECARVLRRAGVSHVYVAALAKTQPPKALRPNFIPRSGSLGSPR
ncbi:MAG: ComF family protein [Phycisphaerales bacterium]|nr:ComF family protein [Phycisphaerales bacterium]